MESADEELCTGTTGVDVVSVVGWTAGGDGCCRVVSAWAWSFDSGVVVVSGPVGASSSCAVVALWSEG